MKSKLWPRQRGVLASSILKSSTSRHNSDCIAPYLLLADALLGHRGRRAVFLRAFSR